MESRTIGQVAAIDPEFVGQDVAALDEFFDKLSDRCKGFAVVVGNDPEDGIGVSRHNMDEQAALGVALMTVKCYDAAGEAGVLAYALMPSLQRMGLQGKLFFLWRLFFGRGA